MNTPSRFGFGSLSLAESDRMAKPVTIADAKRYAVSIKAGARALRKLQAIEERQARPVGAGIYETDAVQLERLADVLKYGGKL